MALAFAGAGCAGSAVDHGPVFATLPPGAAETAWVEPLVRRAAGELFSALSTRGPAALIELRLHGDEIPRIYTDQGQARLARSMDGLTPRASERRWTALRAFAGNPVVGWCARGVHLAEANGPEGFRERVLTVDRLLVVGREPSGQWAMWLEGLAFTAQGWRFLPTVPYGEAVQPPRRDHADVDLWDCDLGVRPPPRTPLPVVTNPGVPSSVPRPAG